MFSYMLVEFNFQKLVYICILSQTLKLESFFPFKNVNLKKEKKRNIERKKKKVNRCWYLLCSWLVFVLKKIIIIT